MFTLTDKGQGMQQRISVPFVQIFEHGQCLHHVIFEKGETSIS